MEDSYFLYKKRGGSKFYFKSAGCCESMGYWAKDNSSEIYEFISLNEIEDTQLRNPEIIEEYLALISEFLDITLERISNPTQKEIEQLPSNFTTIVEKDWNEQFICFKIGKFLSNKHFVAMHTLIRYLWYSRYGYGAVINSVINLRRINPEILIEDVFAISHSFQERTNRALTGANQASTSGFIYFKDKSEYLPDLKGNTNFNSVFDSNNIIIIPKVKISGSFFEDSEIILETKQFISFLTDSEASNPLISNTVFNKILDTYSKYKEVFNFVRKEVHSISSTRVTKCDIIINDSEAESISFEMTNQMNGRKASGTFDTVDKLKTFINNHK